MKLQYIKNGKCQCCKTKNEDLYKVKAKGKEQGWCELCLRGYFLTKNIDDKTIDSYFDGLDKEL